MSNFFCYILKVDALLSTRDKINNTSKVISLGYSNL